MSINPAIHPEIRRQTVLRLLHEGCSCVVFNFGEMRLFHERGVADLYRLLQARPSFLFGAFVADKVVGKAAAALMVLGEVDSVYAGVVSRPALDLFRRYRIPVSYRREVPYVANRAGTGRCPLETRCWDDRTPEECLGHIRAFLAEGAAEAVPE